MDSAPLGHPSAQDSFRQGTRTSASARVQELRQSAPCRFTPESQSLARHAAQSQAGIQPLHTQHNLFELELAAEIAKPTRRHIDIGQ
jgi:hypothetical protein